MWEFLGSGIWPFNNDIFDDDKFLSSYVTDKPNPLLVLPTVQQQSTSPLINTKKSAQIPEAIRPFPRAGPCKETFITG